METVLFVFARVGEVSDSLSGEDLFSQGGGEFFDGPTGLAELGGCGAEDGVEGIEGGLLGADFLLEGGAGFVEEMSDCCE